MSETLRVLEVRSDLLDPNPWNPNRMSAAMQAKLTAYLRDQGLVEPVVVRPHPTDPARYQILGGEHRWRSWVALGHATTPCSIVEVDDRRAKILTINLNDLHGEASPILMATLLEQLAAEVTPRELAEILPWTEEDVLARIDLGHAIPAIEERVATAEAVHRASAPVQLAFMLTPDEAKMVEATIAQATAMLTGKNLRGRGLHLICERFRQTSAE